MLPMNFTFYVEVLNRELPEDWAYKEYEITVRASRGVEGKEKIRQLVEYDGQVLLNISLLRQQKVE